MDWFGPPVFVQRAACKFMLGEARASMDGNETGGFLFGAERANDTGRTALLVHQAGGPGPKAVRGPAFFRPDVIHAQALALDAFQASQSQWIGTWHTHLRSRHRRPSASDLATYRAHLRDPALGFARFLCVILTPTVGLRLSLQWERVRCWAWIITPARVVEASVTIVDEEGTG